VEEVDLLIATTRSSDPAMRCLSSLAPKGHRPSDAPQPVLFGPITRTAFNKHSKILVIVVNLTTFMLYGLISSDLNPYLDVINIGMLFYWAIDVLLTIASSGLRAFWFVPHSVYSEMRNRFEFTVSVPPLLAFIVNRVLERRFLYDNDKAVNRIFILIPIMRTFTVMSAIRYDFLGVR
jgi:hypothetical protein